MGGGAHRSWGAGHTGHGGGAHRSWGAGHTGHGGQYYCLFLSTDALGMYVWGDNRLGGFR